MFVDPLLSFRPESDFAAIDEIRESGAWRRCLGQPAVVT